MSLPHSIHVVSHPLVQHKLSLMRDKTLSTAQFRRLLGEIGCPRRASAISAFTEIR
jgi:uracil phosphoribosyltransferase